MILMGDVDAGAEEWFCPTCNRRMLMRWEPEFDTLLLEHGDATAIHFGGKGCMQLNDIVVSSEAAETAEGQQS
jgi:hypothetical protein